MAISISIDNDRVTGGIQPLLGDESGGVQTPISTDDGNEVDVTLSQLVGGSLGGFSTAFNTFLNGGTLVNHTGLTDVQKQYAAAKDGASSSASFVQVTTTNNETISDLFFSDAQGLALDGDQVANMKTLDNQSVYLWSNGDYCIATTSNVAGSGRIVAAFYLKDDAADHKTAAVQMVSFEPLQHPDGTNADDQLNFTDVMRVSAAGTISFNFDNLESGSFLWAAVGSSSAGLLVTGQDLDVIDGGSKNGEIVKGGGDPSDSVNTSQGGIGATIGINSQHFADQSGQGGTKLDGPVGVFTLVNGFVPLTGVAQATGIDVDQIDYANYVNAPSAKIFISQVTGGTASMKITLWEAGGNGQDRAPADLKPEEGYADTANSYSYIGNQDTDSHLKDDIAVGVATVTVKRGATTFTFNATGTQGGISVTINGNAITLSGIQTGDTIGFAAVNSAGSAVDGTFNRFDIQALANTAAFDIGRIDLDQGVSVNSAVGDQLILEDDGPSITSSATGAPTLTVDETTPGTDDTQAFAGQFTKVYGTDGPAATPVLYSLTTSGGASGLTDTLSGQSVVLSKNATTGNIEGKTATSGLLVFVISVDASGNVTLDGRRAVVHTPDSGPDQQTGLSGANKVVLNATAVDGDTDTAAAQLDLTALLVFKDDAPTITASTTNAPTLTVDETTFGSDDTKGFAGQFTPDYKADGPAGTPVTYALSTPGGATGLTDTLSGQSVVLVQVGATVEGRTSGSGLTVFVISVDASGNVKLDGKRAVVHSPDSGPDQSTGITGTNLVVLTATAHDGDADTASAPLDLTPLLNFKDDAPTITASTTNAPTLTVDETTFSTDDTKGFSGQFTPDYKADGPGGTPTTYALSTSGGASGLTDTLTGQSVVLSLNASGQVEGRTSVSNDLVFVVSVDSSGNVKLDGKRAVVHTPDSGPDQSTGLTGTNKIVLTAVAHDGDGDTASAPLDLTPLLNFKDDAPTISSSSSGAPTLTVDETNFALDDSDAFSPQFTVDYKADGPGATPLTYALSTSGGASGLVDTLTGQNVVLSKNGTTGNIEGRTATSNDLVFVISVDVSGNVTLDGKRAVVHIADSGTDQSKGLIGTNLVVLTATAHDGDDDTASANLDLTPLLSFKDDAPEITGQIADGTVNFVDNASVTNSLNGDVNADAIANANNLSQGGVKQYTITSFTEPTSVYPNLDGVLSADGTKVTYYSDATHTTAVYELALDQSGAGTYTFTVLEPPPVVQNNFTFTDLPSGQNLFGIIANNKADLSQGGLLVTPSNPVLDANGMFTNASGTINTSKGGGPVTIGNANQAFDNPGEGAYFMYVDNPTSPGVGGLGLTATNADDADTISFNGTNEATRASVTIVQASGAGTAKRPGPAMHITAYDTTPGNVDTSGEARTLVNNPTLAAANGGTAAPEVNIIGIKIHDSTGKVIEYRTLNQATGEAVLQDSDDAGTGITEAGDNSAVDITFTRDLGAGTVSTSDDIYSATIGNLKAGYTVEFITAEDHNLALVQNVAGSYDIGGFNIFRQSNIPAQDFDFSVQITDYDNDLDGGTADPLANFSVHVNDLIFP